MRFQLYTIVVASLAALCGRVDATGPSTADQLGSGKPATVLIELFTSEGCSSCPPADDLLGEIVRRQPLANVTVIGLGEHVDYWDRLGWRDSFSSPIFTSRQSEYETRVFRTGSIYTPQLVVDGRYQVLGSDRAAVLRAIADAARLPKAPISIRADANRTAEVHLQIQGEIPSGVSRSHSLDVVAGIVEHDLVTPVQRGENRGRTLRHFAVARTLTVVGTVPSTDRAFSKMVAAAVKSTWKTAELQAVAFLQDRTTRQIVGAASSRIDIGESGQ